MQRVIVLNVILACVIGVLGFQGYLTKPYTGEAAPMVATISVAYLLFLWCIYRRNYPWAKWICKRLTTLGLIGTVIGLLIAFGAADFSKDAQTLMASILKGVFFAYYCTLAGLISNTFASACLGIAKEWEDE